METSKKNASKKVVRKKDWNSTEKRKCRVKCTRHKLQYMAGAEFNNKKNMSHYVNVRTNGCNQSLERSQTTY